MKTPNRKRVSSPKNQATETEKNKKRALICQRATQAKGQSLVQDQENNATISRISLDVTESKGLHRGLHSTDIRECVTVSKSEGTEPSCISRNEGEETFGDENTEFDAREVALRRALLMESLGLHLVAGRKATRNISSHTNLPGHTINSMETHNVSDRIKVEVAEAHQDPSEIGTAAGPAQFPCKTPLWQQPGAAGPTGTEIDPSLVVQASFMLIQSLTLSTEWTVKPHESGVTLLMLSKTKPHSVQREIDVHVSGSLAIFVHRVPLKKDHELWTALPPPVSLAENTVEHFIHYMRALVYTMRQYPICSGVSNEQYKEIWPEMIQATIDENEFQEARYSQTCRSLKCDLVVKQRELRCHACRYLYNNLRVKIKKPPFTFTPGGQTTYSMTKQEIVEKAKLLQRENMNLRETVQRLRGALSRDVSMDSGEQDVSVTNLTPTQRISLEPKVSPLLRGVFSRDVSLDRSAAQDVSVTNLTPTHRISVEPKVSPLLRGAFSRDPSLDRSADQDVQVTEQAPAPGISIQPKLTPSVQSTEPSLSGQTECKQNCSSPSECDTTPLTAVVKKLKQRLQTISPGGSSIPTTSPS